jgi:endoglucanase
MSPESWIQIGNCIFKFVQIRAEPFDCAPDFLLSCIYLSDLMLPMRAESVEFLRTLVNTPSPVGHEVRGQRVWLDYAKQFAEETFSDAYGNCVAVLNKGGSPRLMLAGHADEIALVVNYINEDGYIYVRKMGGVDAAITKAQRVIIHTRNGPLQGVVGNVAPHLMRDEKEAKAPKIHDLFIDVGAANRKEAEKTDPNRGSNYPR